MKTKLKIFVLAVCAVLCLSLLTACGGGGDDWNPTGKDVTLIAKGEAAKYLCIYDSNDEVAKDSAMLFKNEIISKGLKCVSTVFNHTSEKSDFEILFGETDREASKVAAELLKNKIAEDKEDGLHWVFYYRDGKLAVIASDSFAYELAIEDFFDKYLTDKGIVFKDTLKEHCSVSAEEYFRRVAEEKKKEHEEEIGNLTALLEAQRTELSTVRGKWDRYADASATNKEVYLFADYTENLFTETTTKWDSPSAYPTNEHPRLLLTKDNLPLLKKTLLEDSAYSLIMSYVDATLDNNCILPEATYQGENPTVQSSEIHNFSTRSLYIIQAKALAYLLFGDEYYGYQAILYMKNYIKSLDIKSIPSDQCRYYGYVMYTAAIVYDWCYDLLTETDKTQIIAGVENCLCRDDKTKKIVKQKMEVRFPPDAEAAIAGHGNEYQVLRDYLSFAIAVYGDNNSWYEYVGGRVYHDAIPARNYLYQTGVVWQGTGYSNTRHASAYISAWMLQVATGDNPYDDVLHDAVWGLLNYEVAPGYTFTDGDKTGDVFEEDSYIFLAYMAAYLYGDSDLLAKVNRIMYEYFPDSSPFSSPGYGGINHIARVVLRSLCKLEASEGDGYDNMELIKYYGSFLGQYVVREAWGDESSAAVFMKIKERSTGGHEHMDAGTFEIYYKGMLTSDGGCYNNDGHVQSMYFHDATISHNGLIIFNPALSKTESGYYSGGQRRPDNTNSMELDDWISNGNMDTGKVIGRQHGYADDAETQPLYAYIAGDITKAYDATTVSYVGRRMLTVYTGDEDYPMVFFVFDDIFANSKSFEKRFLLQISSDKEPTISGSRVITENGDGRLVLACLSSNVSINPVGGRSYDAKGNYDGKNSNNYCVNGVQLVPQNPNADDGHWGRVEIVSTASTAQTTFMNAIYVTDKGNDDFVDIKKLSNPKGVEGGIFNKQIAAVFATDRNGAKDTLSFSVSANGSVDYYVSGVAAGEWKVSVDGKDCGTYTATAEGGLLTFTAPAGSVSVTPVNLSK